MTPTTDNGAVLYHGPSRLDPAAMVVAIVTGLQTGSSNRKTGGMAQTWILDASAKPTDAVKDGRDRSVCGDCRLRGEEENGLGRSCYVTLVQAPNHVWRYWSQGRYPTLRAAEASRLLRRRAVRLGAYGDPAAVPVDIWRDLIREAVGWTGYTHQWRRPEHQCLRELCMASVDDRMAKVEAELMGWRTFRVMGNEDRVSAREEVLCPASKEAGHLTTCYDCRLCTGVSQRAKAAKSVAIYAHAHPVAFFKSRQRALELVGS
jgi:hypothetical protein